MPTNGEILTSNIQPTKVGENEYRLGLWVRDSASGVGTMSFYEPNSKKFGALGHGISDSDTGELLNIESGEIITSKLVNITKGRKGIPGEIKGSISNGTELGQVDQNTNFGIFGQLENDPILTQTKEEYKNGLEIATRDEIKTGEASILCSLENDKIEEYKIKITEIDTENNTNNKSMKVEVTDEKLIEKTGRNNMWNEWVTNNTKQQSNRSINKCAGN